MHEQTFFSSNRKHMGIIKTFPSAALRQVVLIYFFYKLLSDAESKNTCIDANFRICGHKIVTRSSGGNRTDVEPTLSRFKALNIQYPLYYIISD